MTITATLTDDQSALRDAFGAFFAKESPPERVRAAEPLGFDARLWEQLVALGVPDLALAGQTSLADLVVVAEQFGRSLAPVPFVEALVAARVLERTGGCPDDVASGAVVATFAPRGATDGVARLAPAGAVAEVLVTLDGPELVMVRTPRGSLPGSPRNLACTPVADRRVDGERTVLATGADARAEFARAVDEWRVLTAVGARRARAGEPRHRRRVREIAPAVRCRDRDVPVDPAPLRRPRGLARRRPPPDA